MFKKFAPLAALAGLFANTHATLVAESTNHEDLSEAAYATGEHFAFFPYHEASPDDGHFFQRVVRHLAEMEWDGEDLNSDFVDLIENFGEYQRGENQSEIEEVAGAITGQIMDEGYFKR